MNKELYSQTQIQLTTLAGLVADLPLIDFINADAHAETIGPIVDPTLYRQAGAKLRNVIRLAEAFREVQKEVQRQLAEQERTKQ